MTTDQWHVTPSHQYAAAGKAGDAKHSLNPAQNDTASPRQLQKTDMSPASASASSVATPMQPALAANKDLHSDSVQSLPTKGGSTVATKDSPITPLQGDLSYPQRREYTPSDSDLTSGAKPSAGSESASKHAQHICNGGSGKVTQPVLEGKFDQVNRKVTSGVYDSSSNGSIARSSPQHSAGLTAVNSPVGSHGQTQLSSPQSCPSTPASQMSTTPDSNDGYRSVTHVNSCFAKSDDGEEQRDDASSSSSVDQDQHATAANLHTSDEGDERLRMSDRLQGHSKSLKAACKASSQVTSAASQLVPCTCGTYKLCRRCCQALLLFYVIDTYGGH